MLTICKSTLRLLKQTSFVLLAVCVAFTASIVIAAEPGDVKPGDTVVVTKDTSQLKVESTVVGIVAKGQKLQAIKVQGEWIWTAYKSDGKQIKGWVHVGNVALAKAEPPKKSTKPKQPDAKSKPKTKKSNPKTKPSPKKKTKPPKKSQPKPPKKKVEKTANPPKTTAQPKKTSPATKNAVASINKNSDGQTVAVVFNESVSDAALAGLKDHASVTAVILRDSKISDAGLQQLKGLANLEVLVLSGTNVTDAGLKTLQGIKSLRTLWVHGTKVTDAGVSQLQKALPGVTIAR